MECPRRPSIGFIASKGNSSIANALKAYYLCLWFQQWAAAIKMYMDTL